MGFLSFQLLYPPPFFLQDKTNQAVDLIPEMWNSGNALMFILACQIQTDR